MLTNNILPISTLDLSLKLNNDFNYLPIKKILSHGSDYTIQGYNFESEISFSNSIAIFNFISHPICYDGIKFFSDNVYFRINFIDKENPEYIFHIHRAVIDRYADIILNENDEIVKYNITLKGDISLDEPILVSASREYNDLNNINEKFINFLNNIKPENNVKLNSRYFIQFIKGDKYDWYDYKNFYLF